MPEVHPKENTMVRFKLSNHLSVGDLVSIPGYLLGPDFDRPARGEVIALNGPARGVGPDQAVSVRAFHDRGPAAVIHCSEDKLARVVR